MAHGKRINLKIEIESICWRIGVSPKDVELIEIRPMDVSVTLHAVATEFGHDQITRTVPFDWAEDEGGDGEAL